MNRKPFPNALIAFILLFVFVAVLFAAVVNSSLIGAVLSTTLLFPMGYFLVASEKPVAY